MSDILCRWLNQELRLSKAVGSYEAFSVIRGAFIYGGWIPRHAHNSSFYPVEHSVEPQSFAKDFSTGYLIGEVLHKYQLQNDFILFMRKDTSSSKLNNFTRLEPTLHLLGISFDINTVKELIKEKQGVATRLLYQLYVSLERKRRSEITRTMMESMQSAANASLHKKEHVIYSDQLHRVVKRGAELKLQKISSHYEAKNERRTYTSVMTHPIQPRRPHKVQEDKKTQNIDKQPVCRQKHNDILPYTQAAVVQVPKPPPYTARLNLKRRQQQQRKQQAESVQAEIAQFETSRKKLVSSGFTSSSSGQPGVIPISGSSYDTELHGSENKLILKSNSEYIEDIRQRLEENAVSREQREKRRDRFLVEQLKAHEAQEEARREDQMVKRLTRQTQQEQRLASQLLKFRMQKEVIRQNRLLREKQCQQRRDQDFQEALDREATLAQQAKVDHAEEIKKELAFLDRIAAERAQSRYKKHFRGCKDILEQIVDYATKVGEYRLITANQIPDKLIREWKELLLSDLPLYASSMGQKAGIDLSTPLDCIQLGNKEILNNQDYDEYINMVGEWAWPEEAGRPRSPPGNNTILGHVVLRLRHMTQQPVVEATSTPFPHFTIKACILGKFCSGKSTCLAKIAEANGICVLSADTLVGEVLKAYYEHKATERQLEKDERRVTSSKSRKAVFSDHATQEENKGCSERLSTRAMQGAAAEKELRNGNPIPDELLVDIIVEAIRQVPAQTGWILDGFPLNINQAYLLEKALGGAVDLGGGVGISRKDLVVDPDPPEPLPPPDPVLDLVLLLDVPDETVTTHAFSHTDTSSLPTDTNVYLAQIPHRITAFQDTWPELEKWFGGNQDILVCIDANVEEEELNEKVESVVKEVMMRIHDEQPPPVTDEVSSPTESSSSLHKERARSGTSHHKSSTHSSRGHSRISAASTVTNDEGHGVHRHHHESASASLASAIYIDKPLPPVISQYLCNHWDTVCDSYVGNIKTVMGLLRSQNTVIIHHQFNLREEFKHYLRRPDMRQELVSQWQRAFNSIADDMREDEETKAELHLRLDELRERLWDISDKRKEANEQERASLMYNGWVEENTAILINHHSTLMQVELDRFQETLCILRLYYVYMHKHLGLEPPSHFVCIPLLAIQDENDLDNSSTCSDTADTSVSSRPHDGEEMRITKLVPFLSKNPDSSQGSKTQPVGKPSPDKILSDYEEAHRTISRLVTGEDQQVETKEQKEKPPEKESATASTTKKGKGKPPVKEPPPPEPAHAPPPEERKCHDHSVRDKIHKEYSTALEHEENAAKVRLVLVKGRGLVVVERLKSTTEQVFSDMEKWLEDRFLSEMKSIEQLGKVVRHHIEAGAKLKNELVLECTDFYLNGDCYMVASPTPPPHPPPLEKSTLSTPTILQLESLHQHLCNIAPSGLMSSSEFSSLLGDITSVNMGRDVLPEPWISMNKKQLLEIESMLVDQCDLIDWRRFLLSAALPWPFPSLPQLLVVLKRFKAADTGNTGYINREQYLQTELWFSSECVQPVPEDPSEPLPYNRLANLRKFFFQLFADHSSSPPRLDYGSMLQYFAADPSPRQGFIRALSVVLGYNVGQHISLGHLVESMPSIEGATELCPPEPDGEGQDSLFASSSPSAEQDVSIPALLSVVCHKVTKMKDGSKLPPGCVSEEEHAQHLVDLFSEHGYTPESCVPFSILYHHPLIQVLMESSIHHQLVNIHGVLLANQSEGEAESSG